MINIRRELELRNEEASSLLRFLSILESGENASNNLRQSIGRDYTAIMTSIKAGVVLMLYNAVESTMTKCLERLHDIFIQQNLGFDECTDEIRHLLLVYYEYAQEKSLDIHKRVPYILQLHDYMKGEINFPLSYSQLCQFYSLYSGNLDSREIISVLKKYGIDFEEKVSELKTIKDDRNKLAHGEQTFEEVGRELSLPQLEHMKERTFSYMGSVIDTINDYIKNEKYRKSKRIDMPEQS